MVAPLDPNSEHTPSTIVDKVNEVVEMFNQLMPDVQNAMRELTAIQESRMNREEKRRKELVDKLNHNEITVDVILARWKVAFYDDVPHELSSPVYCVNCMMQAQSLYDRILLDPNAFCEGCIEKSKWG